MPVQSSGCSCPRQPSRRRGVHSASARPVRWWRRALGVRPRPVAPRSRALRAGRRRTRCAIPKARRSGARASRRYPGRSAAPSSISVRQYSSAAGESSASWPPLAASRGPHFRSPLNRPVGWLRRRLSAGRPSFLGAKLVVVYDREVADHPMGIFPATDAPIFEQSLQTHGHERRGNPTPGHQVVIRSPRSRTDDRVQPLAPPPQRQPSEPER